MSKAQEYQVALTDGGSLTYANTSFFASDDAEALQKAKDWVRLLDDHPDGAWLVLNVYGRGITLKPGSF